MTIGAEDSSSSRPLHQSSLVELAAAELRRRILSGELAQGQRLVEERLTEELAISRPPLREAMRLLEQDGLIVKLPRMGSHVISLTPNDYWELLTLRHSLEVMVFQLVVPNVTDEVLEELRDKLELMKDCAQRENRADMVEAGYAFHLAMVNTARHSRITDIYRSMQAQLQLCMAMNTKSNPESLKQNVARHSSLLSAFASGDLDKALRELDAHGHGRFIDATRGKIGTEIGTPNSMNVFPLDGGRKN